MGNIVFVGNLEYTIGESDIREIFESFGSVNSVSLIRDNLTKMSRGYAFIEMGSAEEARTAIFHCNEKEFKGRTLVVNEARAPKVVKEWWVSSDLKMA